MLSVLYLLAIVAANLTVTTFGPTVTIINAFLFIGFDLLIRDQLHDQWQKNHLALRMGLLITAGGVISYALNADAARIALASSIAFAAAATVDAITYHALRRYPFLVRANASNTPSALVDSILFPTLAFGAFLWPIVLGQFIAKVAGGAMWSVIINAARNVRRHAHD